MKKLLLTALFVVTFFSLSAVSASAVVNDRVKVGLWYGSNALFSANLENSLGEGYEFGWFDESREFRSLGRTGETQISMTAAGDIYMNGNGAYSPDIPSGTMRTLRTPPGSTAAIPPGSPANSLYGLAATSPGAKRKTT